MRSGLWLPPFEELADPRVVAKLAAEAEERGWHGVFLWDQLRWREPIRQVADPWIILAAIAAATEHVRLGAQGDGLPSDAVEPSHIRLADPFVAGRVPQDDGSVDRLPERPPLRGFHRAPIDRSHATIVTPPSNGPQPARVAPTRPSTTTPAARPDPSPERPARTRSVRRDRRRTTGRRSATCSGTVPVEGRRSIP
jgi:hypothetical protein